LNQKVRLWTGSDRKITDQTPSGNSINSSAPGTESILTTKSAEISKSRETPENSIYKIALKKENPDEGNQNTRSRRPGFCYRG
jgi:hypothetical protein